MALEDEWRSLEVHSGLPFSSWDWAIAWWSQLREDKLGVKDSLFVVVMRADGGELLAVAPMLISRRPSVGPICVRQLQFFGADPNITELRGLVALPAWRADAYRALLAYANEHAAEWDTLLLSGMPPELDASALASFTELHWQAPTLDYQLPLPPSWEAFRGALPRNIKESLRKCYNSLKRDGLQFRLEVAADGAEIAGALEHFFRFHAARARLEGTVQHSDVFATAEARHFLVDVCSRFAARGCLRIFQLVVDERVVAVRIGFVVGEALYLYYSGYDAAFAKYSVMTTTVAEAIKYAIEQRMSTVNLSTGKDVSKARWNPVEVVARQVRLVSPSTRGEVAHQVYTQAVRAVGQLPALKRAVQFLSRRSATA